MKTALIAMISKRNNGKELIGEKGTESERAALISILNEKNAPVIDDSSTKDDKGSSEDPRNALVSMLNKQKIGTAHKSLEGENNQSNESHKPSDGEPPLKKDPKYEKYFKMLKMVKKYFETYILIFMIIYSCYCSLNTGLANGCCSECYKT